MRLFFKFHLTSRGNQIEKPPTFIVPLLYGTNSNQTTFWEGSSKHPKIGNESRYQSISKIFTTFKETFNRSRSISKSILQCLFCLFLSLDECSLYQAIVELVTRLQVSTTTLST